MSQLYCEKTKAVLASASAITELVKDDSGLVSHINVFLYDTSMSKNGSMLTEAIGDMSAQSYNDLPLIMTDSLGHNVFPEDPSVMPDGGVFSLTKPISEYIKASRRFEVGRVVNVVKKHLASANNKFTPTWIASVKLTNKKFREFITNLSQKYADIRQAKLFVSSFHVGKAVANGLGKYVYDGPVTGMHIAIVKSPAYPDDKSLITGICIGDDMSCMNNLAAAASYDAKYDQPLIDFNNELLKFTRTLYPSATANKNMSDDNKNQNPEPKDKNPEGEEPKTEGKEAQTVQVKKEEFDALKKTVEELTKQKKAATKEDKPEGDEDADVKEKDKNVKALEARIKQLEREKNIVKWLEKLKPIKGINALQQASLIVDKGFTDEEAENYVKSFAPLIKASANSSTPTKQKSDDALLTKFELASASSYDSYDDSVKKASNKAVNIGVAQFYSQFLKK